MSTSFFVRVVAAAALMVLGACGSTSPSRFYVLTPQDGPALGDAPELIVLPIRLPGEADRASMLLRRSETRRELADLDRWAEPLGDLVARTVRRNLQQRLGPGRVHDHAARFHPADALLLDLDVQQLTADPAGRVELVVLVQIGRPGGDVLATHMVERTTQGPSGGAEGVAEALSLGLGVVCDEVVELLGGVEP